MTKSIQIIFLFSLIAIIGCNQSFSSIGYIDYNKVHSSIDKTESYDALLAEQKEHIKEYTKEKAKYLNSLKLSNDEFNVLAKLYRDTVEIYENNMNSQYHLSIDLQKSNIQNAIDKISKQNNCDFVMSSSDVDVLYIKDSTNILTKLVIDELKVEK